MELSDILGKKHVVVGVGKEGFSVLRFLTKHGIKPFVVDARAFDDLDSDVKKMIRDLDLGGSYGAKYLSSLKDYDVIWRSPGVWFKTPNILEAKENGAFVLSQTEWFLNHSKAKVVGVTGTKGKGTTSTLIYEMLKRATPGKVFLTGNIGAIDPFDIIDELSEEDLVVFELSSFQLEDVTKSPHASVVLMVTSEHLDHHESNNEYVFSKQNIVRFQTEDDFAVINRDYDRSKSMSDITKAEVLWFSRKDVLEEGAFLSGEEVLVKYQNVEYLIARRNEVGLIGAHNIENICASSLTALRLGVPVEVIRMVVRDFKGLPHRLEFVREVMGVRYYNDSFSTVPETTMAAIDSIYGNKVLILGGSEKNSDFHDLVDKIQNSNEISTIILVGESGQRIKSLLNSVSYKGKMVDDLNSMKDIVFFAKESVKSGGAVLLSPGAASFGMFKNYKDRGDQFRQIVLGL